MNVFKTFKPNNNLISKYVDYYYLDIKSENTFHEFQCFPHVNNTISLYASHRRLPDKSIRYDAKANPLQIFTPMRQDLLTVTQIGQVKRLVVVFKPLGIQQFYRNLDFTVFQLDFPFFDQQELSILFESIPTENLGDLLDGFLLKRYQEFSLPILSSAIEMLVTRHEEFSVIKLSEELGVSRQHLNKLFKNNLGISIKKFYNIYQFRLTVNKKLGEQTPSNFTQLAYEFNFSDQSHLIKTYRNLTRNSPSHFFSKGTVLGEESTFWHLNV